MRKHLKPGQYVKAAVDIGDPADKDVPGKLFIEEGESLLVYAVDEGRRSRYPVTLGKVRGGAFFVAKYSEVSLT